MGPTVEYAQLYKKTKRCVDFHKDGHQDFHKDVSHKAFHKDVSHRDFHKDGSH